MATVSCNGIDLHYADTGTGPPLVFLNGLAGDHLYWMGQVRAFSGRRSHVFRCLALDNRDAGRSSYATAPYSVCDLAADVAALLERLELPSAHVVGLSLGGMIAQELALRHPDRVTSLFLIGTLARVDTWFNAMLDAFSLIRRQVADSCAFFEAVLPWLVSHRFFDLPGRVEWLRALFRQNPHPQRIDGFFRQFDAIRQHDTLERLSAIRCPVLVTVGEDDLIAPPRYARQIAERLPQARLEILPGVGHAPPIEAPRPFNQLLGDFLQTVCESRT
jgi:pimeloyl-ACP methyl ester carboxylesterase